MQCKIQTDTVHCVYDQLLEHFPVVEFVIQSRRTEERAQKLKWTPICNSMPSISLELTISNDLQSHNPNRITKGKCICSGKTLHLPLQSMNSLSFKKRPLQLQHLHTNFRPVERSLFPKGHVKMISFFPVRDIPLRFIKLSCFGRIYWSVRYLLVGFIRLLHNYYEGF